MNNKNKMMRDIDGDSLLSNGKAEREGGSLYSGRRSLSPAVMAALSSISDTFLPAVDVPQHADADDDSVKLFFQTSASMAGTPQRVAWMISERLQHPKLILCRLALWLLSTRIGTLMLCGKASLSTQFPFLQSFPNISPHKREDIVRSWSCSYIKLIKTFFLAIKILVLLAFFSQVNENNENISWKAIDYSGPDPDSNKKPTCNSKKWRTGEEQHISEEQMKKEDVPMNAEISLGPLHKGIINLNQEPRLKVFDRLEKLGFPVLLSTNKNPRNPSFVIECDAVVVGSGSGGGVIAGVLANAGHKVVVLEKGKYLARSNLSLLEGTSMDQMYLGNGLVASTDMDILLLAGSTVGGGSTVNWSASIQTPPHVLKEWSEGHKVELFGSETYKQAMETVCWKMGVQSEVEDEGFNNMVLRKGCLELGYPVETIPRNASRDHYCGWCGFGCKDGRKKGTSETWLAEFVDSGNGVILPECKAVKVIHSKPKKNEKTERSKAAGVMFTYQNNGVEELCFVKSRVTVVAGGALCTPSLLRNSGLKNPNIGRNLHLHPVVFGWGYFPDTPSSKAWPEAEKKGYQGGIMTAMSKVVANFEESGYGALIQTPSFHPGLFSAIMPWLSGTDMKTRMQRFSRTAILFALARDKTSGEALSPSSISYNLQKTDKDNLKNGLEKVLRILAAAGAEEIGSCHRSGKVLRVKEASRDEIEEFVEKESSRDLGNLSTLIGSAHQMGSCRMGVEPKSSVVNPMGETWEVEGLFLADSSVFPTALGVNPMVTVQAIAYCTAQSVLKFLKIQNQMQGCIKKLQDLA